MSTFESEFKRVADIVGAVYTTKEIQEEQVFAQNHDFRIDPWINWVPLENAETEIDDAGQTIYIGSCLIRFLTKSDRDDQVEANKNILIDDMFAVAQAFYFELQKNVDGAFIQPTFNMRHKIERQFTSNILVGTSVTMDFRTGCAARGFKP